MDANVVTDLEKIAQSEDLADKLPSGRKLTGAQACYEVEAL